MLPVRPSTFAASRLWAALVVGVTFIAAVTLPSALIYSAFAAGHPLFRGHLSGLFAGTVSTPMLGALFVYLVLLVLRGLAAIVLGARSGAWIGAGLQLVTVILLVETFFFLPGVLGSLVKAVMNHDPRATWLPPVWFAALAAWLAGSREPMMATATLYTLWFLAPAALVVPVYLVPARWLGLRALESRGGERAGKLTALLRGVAIATHARPVARAIYAFAAVSLVRSRRHLLILATYVGIAIAMGIVAVLIIGRRGHLPLSQPAPWLLAVPMLFMFLLSVGLRTGFRIPTELEANWPFRVAQPTPGQSANGAALVMFTLAVFPIVLLMFVILAPLWTVATAATAAGLLALAGLLLVETLLFGWRKVPYASGHTPSTDALKKTWPIYLWALYVFAFKLSDWLIVALTSRPALLAYVAACGSAILLLRAIGRARLRQNPIEFDAAPADTLDQLKLSGALH